ncbi:MAG: ATP-binding cassette domain-containing protein [Anaerolineae bacterium]
MSSSNKWAIETQSLAKRYNNGEILAIEDLDLKVEEGSTYALLGPNGAGKTTTISILTTLIQPTAGSAMVSGFDVVRQSAQVRRRIGVTFQDIVLDDDLTGLQVLHVHGQLYRQDREVRDRKIKGLVELVELQDAIDRKVRTYSGGMKRRLELARGLMTEPEILFLDEPTQGLDPQNRAAVWEYLRQLQDKQALTILLTTHYMEEAEALADRVGIIDHGSLVVEGTPRELIEGMGSDVVNLSGQGNHNGFLDAVRTQPFVQRVNDSNNLVQIGVDHGNRRLATIVELASQHNYTITEIGIAKPSLGDVFLKYTGRQLRDQ